MHFGISLEMAIGDGVRHILHGKNEGAYSEDGLGRKE